MRILGLDLSTVASGWAVLDDTPDSNKVLVAKGVIHTIDDWDDEGKLFFIARRVDDLITLYHPNELAIEDTFMGHNAMVLKKLSRVAGAVQFVWFSRTGVSPSFYMAVTARPSIQGLKGTATKEDVVNAVNHQFNLRGTLKDDNIADAIVVGYHHLMKDSIPWGNVDSSSAVSRVITKKVVTSKIPRVDLNAKEKARVRVRRNHSRTK